MTTTWYDAVCVEDKTGGYVVLVRQWRGQRYSVHHSRMTDTRETPLLESLSHAEEIAEQDAESMYYSMY